MLETPTGGIRHFNLPIPRHINDAVRHSGQRIESVAQIITERRLTIRQAELINEDRGWSYLVRWANTTYHPASEGTEVRGDRLTDSQLQEAIYLVQQLPDHLFLYADDTDE